MPYGRKIGHIPLTTVQRLPDYLRQLRRIVQEGGEFVSSARLSEMQKVEAIQVRKDIAHIGITGRPKTGYRVAELLEAIERCLSWNRVTDALLVGTGHLGTALLGYRGFANHGLNIVAAFDSDQAVTGKKLHAVPVYPMSKLSPLAQKLRLRMAILTVSPEAAQLVADKLVDAGIEGIWNFTGVQLSVPADVIVQDQDISTGLAVLSAKLTARSTERLPRCDGKQEGAYGGRRKGSG
jgi:redox-sensing transcriptional repressor